MTHRIPYDAIVLSSTLLGYVMCVEVPSMEFERATTSSSCGRLSSGRIALEPAPQSAGAIFIPLSGFTDDQINEHSRACIFRSVDAPTSCSYARRYIEHRSMCLSSLAKNWSNMLEQRWCRCCRDSSAAQQVSRGGSARYRSIHPTGV